MVCHTDTEVLTLAPSITEQILNSKAIVAMEYSCETQECAILLYKRGKETGMQTSPNPVSLSNSGAKCIRDTRLCLGALSLMVGEWRGSVWNTEIMRT